ncbi:hypothetical protein ACFQVA_16155 [Actinomadura keratinilytica]
MSDSRDTSPTAPPLLPVGGAELRRDPALHEAVRRVGQRVGVDFTDDERVREELRRGRDALADGSATTGPGCLAFLLLIVAAGLAVADQISPALTAHRPALLAARASVPFWRSPPWAGPWRGGSGPAGTRSSPLTARFSPSLRRTA